MNRRELTAFINGMTAPVLRRVRGMIGRCILDMVDDSGGRQMVQVHLYGGMETLTGVERFQAYGHNAVPPAGAEGIFAKLSGSPDHVVVLVMESRDARPKGWQPGESGLYDNLGQLVHLTRAGIVIDGAGLPVTVQNTPSVTIDGDLHVTGTIDHG